MAMKRSSWFKMDLSDFPSFKSPKNKIFAKSPTFCSVGLRFWSYFQGKTNFWGKKNLLFFLFSLSDILDDFIKLNWSTLEKYSITGTIFHPPIYSIESKKDARKNFWFLCFWPLSLKLYVIIFESVRFFKNKHFLFTNLNFWKNNLRY